MLAVEVIDDPKAAAVALDPVSPRAMGPVAADPDGEANRLSASYLIALAARIVREVKDLPGLTCGTDKRLPTLSVDTVIRFRSAAAAHMRLVVAAHPLPHKSHHKEES